MYQKLRNSPDIWGKGQLFAFSGLDGVTDWFRPLVLNTAEKKASLNVKLPFECPIEIETPPDLCFDIVIGDVIAGRSQQGPVIVTLTDCRTIIGMMPSPGRLTVGGQEIDDAVSTIKGDGDASLAAIRRGDRFVIKVTDSTQLGQEECERLLGIDIFHVVNIRTEYLRRIRVPENISDEQKQLLLKAASVMKVNVESASGRIKSLWTTPDRWPHRNMWLWDSAFHGIGFKEFDPSTAQLAITAVFEQIRDDGMLPHTTSPETQSEITQPPILAWAVREISRKTEDMDWVNRCQGPLFRYLEWIRLNRDKNNNCIPEWHIEGNPLCRCGECGLDNSPLYDKATLLDSVDFASYLCNDYRCLAEISQLAGNTQLKNQCLVHADAIKTAVNTHLWSELDSIYYSREFGREFVAIKTIASFMPLFAGIARPQQASKLLEHLQDETSFASAFPIPSTSLDSGQYCKDMWRGPTWLNTNYLVYQGILEYGYKPQANALRTVILKTVNDWFLKTGCLFEFYDSLDYTCPSDLDRKQTLTNNKNSYRVICDYNWTAAVCAALIYETECR